MTSLRLSCSRIKKSTCCCCSCPSFFILLCTLLLLLLQLDGVAATITIMDTGRRYRSRQDLHMGKRLWKGYEYMGRLQFVEGNLPLCPENYHGKKYNLTVPADNLPVALLVRGGGGCTLQEKINVTLNHIEPPGLVKYLIVDDTAARYSRVSGVPAFVRTNSAGAGNAAGDSNSALPGNDEDIVFPDEEGPFYYGDDEDVGGGGGKKKDGSSGDERDEEVPLYILHVSSRTEFDLLNYLYHQPIRVFDEGGPRITIDSRLSAGILDGEGAMWIALSALLSACACSFLLIAAGGTQQGWWIQPEEDDAQQQQPVRRQRRRLTREQVKRLLPVYRYDGTALHLIEQVKPPTVVAIEEEEQEQQQQQQQSEEHGLLLPDSSDAAALLPPQPPEPVELSLCSICLDDYEPGDRLRCLPTCNHAFHAKCVGKWLAERSATCPLCKAELWEEEQEDDDDEEEETAAATGPNEVVEDEEGGGQRGPSWWDRLLFTWDGSVQPTVPVAPSMEEPLLPQTTGVHRQLPPPPTRPATSSTIMPFLMTTTNSADHEEAEARPSSSWWRRVFPPLRRQLRRRVGPAHGEPHQHEGGVETTAVSMLAEPLLTTSTSPSSTTANPNRHEQQQPQQRGRAQVVQAAQAVAASEATGGIQANNNDGPHQEETPSAPSPPQPRQVSV